MKTIKKHIAKKNTKELRIELARTHMIIALLSIAIITLLSLGSGEENYVYYDPTMSAICVVLLVFVTFISLSTSVTIYRNLRK